MLTVNKGNSVDVSLSFTNYIKSKRICSSFHDMNKREGL